MSDSRPGISQLGYLGFEVKDLAAWEKFATQVLGLTVADRRADGALALRMDGHAYRFLIEPGAADDLALLGWEVADEATLVALAAKLREAGTDVSEAPAADVKARRVQRLFRYRDPSGIPSELYVGPSLANDAFVSPLVRSGFVADAFGPGHLVITATDRDASRKFYTELLGFRATDRIIADVHGYKADIEFLHTNARHHSLAFGDAQRKRLHHFMVEGRTMDEVGLAFDRALKAGVRIMQTLGRHPNDRMFSFYAKTPSGFQFEFGWGGREVDDSTWQPTQYDHVSEWGHHPPQFLAPPPPPQK